MATGNEKHRNELHEVILQSVLASHEVPIRRTVKAIKEHDLDKPTSGKRNGRHTLDFLPPETSRVEARFISHSPLMLACEQESEPMVKLLLSLEASAAFKNKEGLNALHIACNKGNLTICKLLLEKALTQDHYGKKSNLKCDISILVNSKEKRGWTPLMYAVKSKRSAEMIQALMETEKASIDYSKTNKKQSNFVHIACNEGSVGGLQYIIGNPPPLIESELKALFTAVDKKGWNILHHACSTSATVGDVSLVEWLVMNIPDTILTDQEKTDLLTQKNEAEYTPFLVACEYQKLEAVKYLSSRDDIDVSSVVIEVKEELIGEKSALHIAAIHDSQQITQVLIERGCKLTCKDAMGNTALHVAYRKSSEAVKKLLVESREGHVLLGTRNMIGQLPKEVPVDDVIPIEILKRGTIVVESYKRALRDGKEKIPRCGLLILGEARKGKTSLYKLIVGHKFDPEQDSTRGIENNEVDAFDSRTVDCWKEKSEADQSVERDELHARAVIKELPPESSDRNRENFKPAEEAELLRQIENVLSAVQREKKLKAKPKPIRSPPSPTPTPSTDQGGSLPPSQGPLHPTARVNKPSPIVESAHRPNREASVPKQRAEAKPKVQPADDPDRDLSPPAPKRAATEPTPTLSLPEPPPVKKSLSVGSTRKDARQVDKMMRNGRDKMDKKDPNVLVNVLDFAGQKNYRPMHHCFIRRRSMYIVVFNLQDILKSMDCESAEGKDPFEEIRYWLHSIHAHIYPPDQSEVLTEEDKHQRRVILVGTHKCYGGRSLEKEDLVDIDREFYDKIMPDNRCADHIHTVNKMCFVPVENSSTDPAVSGADTVRKALNAIQNSLTFLREDYPLSWVRFEGRLIELANDEAQPKCVLRDEVAAIASAVGVPNVDDALQFFHDTGKIILLKRVSKLFLSKEQSDSISDLVIVSQKWLITVMKEIMELSENCSKITGSQQRDLKNGRIARQALERIWSDTVKEFKAINIDRMCIILQAYCLIHPVGCSEDSEVHGSQFVIPCMLPQATQRNKQVFDKTPWVKCKICFDFNGFLPLEVFHRLICMLLNESLVKSEKGYKLFAEVCFFEDVNDCAVKVELDSSSHRINISYVGPKDPSDCIKLIHNQYLKKICEESGLQGLHYCGGVLGGKCGCDDVQHLVEFCVKDACDNATASSTDTVSGEYKCPKCKKTSTLDEVDIFVRSHALSKVKGVLTFNDLLSVQRKTIQENANQEIKDVALKELASHFSDIDDLLPHLEPPLRNSEKTDIKKLETTQDKVCMALKCYKDHSNTLTYRELGNIVEKMKNGELMRTIVESIPQ